jgi:hypothetical protein
MKITIPCLIKTFSILGLLGLDLTVIFQFAEQHHPSEAGARPRILAFNKPYGMRPCFTDDQGLPTLTECVTILEVYAAGDWVWLTSVGFIRTSCR